jgi:hypothetical protein
MLDTGRTQRERFLDTRHAESVSVGERARGVNEAVAVCVGFDRRDDSRGRRKAADYGKVVPQGSSIDGNDRDAAHESP